MKRDPSFQMIYILYARAIFHNVFLPLLRTLCALFPPSQYTTLGANCKQGDKILYRAQISVHIASFDIDESAQKG